MDILRGNERIVAAELGLLARWLNLVRVLGDSNIWIIAFASDRFRGIVVLHAQWQPGSRELSFNTHF